MTEKGVWQRTLRGGKFGFDKLWSYADKAGAPVNKLSNKIGSEAFWPATIDKESYKAARILRSFCRDGIYEDEELQLVPNGPKQKQRVVRRIPPEVFRNAKGLAIFTTMRTGLWFSGAGGSGIVLARMDDGTWSPPSGIILHTADIGLLVGVDIYDCLLILNTQEAIDAFAKWRLTLGGELSIVAGPLGVGGILENEMENNHAPIFTYVRSRGFNAGVQVDGTVVIERGDENEKFYNGKYTTAEILSGSVRQPPPELKMLMETLKAAQGDLNVDESALPTEPPPADFDVVKSDHVFGIPDKEDPDPFGVLALEKEGLQIKAAGSQMAAPCEEFEFKPSVSSPIFDQYNRRSFESTTRSSKRSSTLTMSTMDQRPRYVTMDTATQTDFEEIAPSPGSSEPNKTPSVEDDNPIAKLGGPLPSPKKALPTLPPRLPLRVISVAKEQAPTTIPSKHNEPITESISPDYSDDEEPDDEEPVIHEVHQAARPQSITRPRIVAVPARMKPDLPARSPWRRRGMGTQVGSDELTPEDESLPRDEGSNTSSSDKDLAMSSDERFREGSITSTFQESATTPASSPQRSPSFRSVTSQQKDDRQADDARLVSRIDEKQPKEDLSIAPPSNKIDSSVAIPLKNQQALEETQKEDSGPVLRLSRANMKLSLSEDEDDLDASPTSPRHAPLHLVNSKDLDDFS